MINSQSRSERILELDVLRGLAAISILCLHYTTGYSEHYFPPYPTLFDFPKGYYGISLFFMISGFVIFMTLEKTRNPRDFVVSRFSRLYPGYWAAVILTFSLVRVSHLMLREISLHDVFMNLTMFHEWFNVKSLDPVYWTLRVELSFYILMFIIFLNRGLKYIESLGLLWLVLMIICSRLFWYFHIHMPVIIRQTYLLKSGHLFFAGILFYNLKMKGNSWQRHTALILCLAAGYLVRDSSYDVFFEIGFFVIFYLFIHGYLSRIVLRPFVFLGSISYSLYLIHDDIGFIIIKHLYAVKANAWLCFFIPAVFSIFVAALITYLIEKPAVKFIRQRYAGIKN
ncbi:MAG: acyltransferase [Candidatus Omnitrophica bacterium]|nr:acyltransferase [Candidatus Omnitrophota bacterium]